MSIAAYSVTVSFGFCAFLFAYFGFQLNDSDQPLFQVLGVLFFNISMLFGLGLMWVASQIAENNSLTYLTGGIVPFITALTYIILAVFIGLFFKLIYNMVMLLMDWMGKASLVGKDSRDRKEYRRGER